MEHLVKTFYRVVSGLDDLDTTIASITALSGNTPAGASSITDRRILDFPDPDHESAAIAASSSLAEPELLRRAAEAPQDLTDSEIELLRHRYWAEPPREASKARWDAHRVLGDEIGAVMSRLEEIRAPLYEKKEAYALGNIATEWVRRMMVTSVTGRAGGPGRGRAVEGTAMAVQRLWDEDETRSVWGNGVFVVPGIDEVRLENHRCRSDAVIQWTSTHEDRQPLSPPNDATVEMFQHLRNAFVTARDIEGNGGLEDRIQRNVFLVVDKDAVGSVLSRDGIVDDIWVWAVDPDYTPVDTDEATEGGGQGYGGFVRVRVQQLVHNFFSLRHLQGEEIPMSDLWSAAQRSKGGLFVSVDPAESKEYISFLDKLRGKTANRTVHRTLVGQCPNPEGPHVSGDSIRDILQEENGVLTGELARIVRQVVEAGSKPPLTRPTRSIGIQTEVPHLQTLVPSVGAVQIVPTEPEPRPEDGSLQTVVSFAGVVQIVPTEPKQQAEPPVPDWLTKALVELQPLYPFDSFGGRMKFYPMDPTTNERVHLKDGQPPPAGTEYMFTPRVVCMDCPGKVFVTGPGMTVSRFENHLKRSKHRQRVNVRNGMDTKPLHLVAQRPRAWDSYWDSE